MCHEDESHDKQLEGEEISSRALVAWLGVLLAVLAVITLAGLLLRFINSFA